MHGMSGFPGKIALVSASGFGYKSAAKISNSFHQGTGIMFRMRSICLMLTLLASSLVSRATAADTVRLDAAAIKAALHTATVEEGGFIDYVLAKVKKGDLPAGLVDGTFQWARKKPTKYRFQYFKKALIVRAADMGININPKASEKWPVTPSTTSNSLNRI